MGPAFHAEQARRALGIVRAPLVKDLSASGFHIIAGCAIALSAVALRPEVVGVGASVALDAGLAVIALGVLVYHERTVSRPAGARAGIEPGILPGAALLSLCLVLGGDEDRAVGLAAVIMTAAVIAAVPHLDARRRLGRTGAPSWVTRQFIGVLILAPMLVVAASSGLPVGARFVILAAGATAVGFDALALEDVVGVRGLLAASGAALVVTVAALVPLDYAAGPRAAVLLVVWYAGRALAATIAERRFSRATVVEYGLFAVVAGVALQIMSGR